MNLIKFPKFKTYKDQRVNFMQPKLDGHLTKIYIDNHTLTALTKNDKDITDKLLAIDHIKKELDGLPNNSVVFGELHCPNILATSVPTMLNDADPELSLTAFAAPLLGGKDQSEVDLITMMLFMQELGLDATGAEPIDSPVSPVVKGILLQKAIDRKWEGWVLKESHMSGWYKLKPVRTLDAFVNGTYRSFSSSHYGGLQAINIAVYKPDGKIHDLGHVGGGFKLEYRKQLDSAEKRDQLLDKVCEVSYDSITAGKKLRFPRFIRWRGDKDIENCTTEQLRD